MAKITANGAELVARLRAKSATGSQYLFALNSKGVVLYRFTDIPNGYRVFERKVNPVSRMGLEALVVKNGYTVLG